MAEWWGNLTYVNQVFYGVAAFFSIFFIWQLISALTGLAGDHGDADGMGGGDHDVTYGQFEHGAHVDAGATEVSFEILSIRSISTFLMLFTWGTALYLNQGMSIPLAMGFSIIWGLAGMFVIALILYMLRKMTETGTINLNTAIGTTGTVYLNIPQGGLGEIRVTVSGVVTYVKARGAGDKELKMGAPVRVTRRIDQTTVEVEPIV